ncbi:MAG: hypothetical protein KGO96_14325 [Elusimicrobia bacterium]|nr:hypothetical protein [Elusimicrobiota bacterium]
MSAPFPAWLAAAGVLAATVWAVEQIDPAAAWGLALLALLGVLVIRGAGTQIAQTLSLLVSGQGTGTSQPGGGLGPQNTPQFGPGTVMPNVG